MQAWGPSVPGAHRLLGGAGYREMQTEAMSTKPKLWPWLPAPEQHRPPAHRPNTAFNTKPWIPSPDKVGKQDFVRPGESREEFF